MTDRLTAEQAARAIAKGHGRQPESLILGIVRDYLRAHGWFVVRMQQGLGCHRGIADLCAMRDCRTVWIEVKTETGRLSPYQEGFREAVLAAEGNYVIARCVDDLEAAGL